MCKGIVVAVIIKLKTSVKLLSGASGYIVGSDCVFMSAVMET
jgi:hypothetical protein